MWAASHLVIDCHGGRIQRAETRSHGKGVAMKTVGRSIAIGSILVSGFGCGSKPESPKACVGSHERLPPDRIDDVLRPNVVQIVSNGSLGSGFMLDTADRDNVLIVTNYHVIAEGDQFNVVFVRKDGTRANVGDVEVVKTSPEHDLALLKAPRMTAFGSGLRLGPLPRAGQSVSSLGYPVLAEAGQKVEPALSTGFVAAPKQTIGKRTFVQTDLQLAPGNSGGAAVDSCGVVVGVTSAHHSEQAFVGLLVPAADVDALHAKYRAPRRASDQEVSDRVAAFLQSLQESEHQTAASYLSRGYLAQNVYPKLELTAKSALAKQNLLQRILEALEERNIDVSSLTAEQVQEIAARTGADLSPEELHAQIAIMNAREKGSDTYALLQAFVAPYLGAYFGDVDRFKVIEVKSRDDKQIAYVAVEGGREQNVFRFDFTYEWGDWQITGLTTRDEMPSEDRREAQAERSGEWTTVSKQR